MSSNADIWENEVYLSRRYSERIAWLAFFAMAALAIGVMIWTSLHRPQKIEYVVVKVNAQTGDADITSIVDSTTVSTDAILAEAFVYKYITMRETYDSWDQKRRINEVWSVFTDGRAKRELFNLYADDNPRNPIERHGKTLTVDVKILSITLNDPTSAQVRIQKTFRTANEVRNQNFVINMKFFSDLAREATREFRRKNPVAFFVEEYRIDAEAA